MGYFKCTVAPYHWRTWRLKSAVRPSFTVRSWPWSCHSLFLIRLFCYLTWKLLFIIFLPENSGMQKVTLISCVVKYTPTAVPYSTLLYHIFRSECLVYFLFIVLLVALLSHKHVIPETFGYLHLFPTRRDTITNGKELLVPLHKLKLLVSNLGALLLAPLSWYFFVFKIVGHYVIRFINLLTSIRLSIRISDVISG